MGDWLQHMSEEQRLYAAELIDATLKGMAQDTAVEHVLSPDRSRVILRRLPDRRAGVRVEVSHGRVRLGTPVSFSTRRPAAEIIEPVHAPPGHHNGLVAMLRTLEVWREVLGSPLTVAGAIEAARVRQACTLLITCAAQTMQPGYEMATLEWSRRGGHSANVYSRNGDGSQKRTSFVTHGGGRNVGAMSPEFVKEFDAILGERSHAYVREDPFWRWFHLHFDETPTYLALVRPDPMVLLRALGELPAGVRLIAPRDLT